MTANNVGPSSDMTRFSTNRASQRNDSTQEVPEPSSSTQRSRRPSLTGAMRRASQVIGDGVCESWKELRMLGILPEPESEDDDECGLCLNTTASVQEESHGGDTVKDVDSNNDESFRIVIGSDVRDFEAERQEQRTLQQSFERFSFDRPTEARHDSKRFRRNLEGFNRSEPQRQILLASTSTSITDPSLFYRTTKSNLEKAGRQPVCKPLRAEPLSAKDLKADRARHCARYVWEY